MAKVGRRSKQTWGIGDPCRAQFENEWYNGEVTAVNTRKKLATVLFEDDEEVEMKFVDLHKPETKTKSKKSKEDSGFSVYDIKWEPKHGCTFTINHDGIMFHGTWFRGKAGEAEAFRVTIRASVNGSDIHIEDMDYAQDPKKNLSSLNADICCAISKWFYYSCNEDPVYTITDLRKRAARPVVEITQLSTIDQLIASLKEMKQIAIKCGGARYATIEGDTERDDAPRVTLKIDLSPYAKMYMESGKIPKNVNTATIERAIGTKGKKNQNVGTVKESTSTTADLQSLKDIKKQIESCKDDKTLKKYRKMLRGMGVKGGINGLKKLIEEKSNGK